MSADGGDGRNIDPHLGALAGEAASQAVPADRAGGTWRDPTPGSATDTYYDRPVIKQPVWIWTVPAYFYAGGAAGAASTLGLAVQRRGLGGLARRCRLISIAGVAASTAFLIHDLGRPGRFHHMLRVFRPTSPMNMGSWFLAAYGPAAGAAAVLPAPLAGMAGGVAGVLGLPVAAYTGVLLGQSAVPVWLATRRELPLLFCASAVTSAASLLQVLPQTDAEGAVVRRYAVMGKAAELIMAEAVQRRADAVESVGRPLHAGRSGMLWRAAKVLTGSSLALSVVPRRSRRIRVASGVLGTAGAIATRFAVVAAGHASAANPRATFDQQHA